MHFTLFLPPMQICKTDIDLPVVMNQGISNFQGYPPRVMIHLGSENPDSWTLRLTGLTEEVVFTVTPAVKVCNSYELF